jgi:hypothetical protein
MEYTLCICGHEPEEHKGETGECEVENCGCACYELDEEPYGRPDDCWEIIYES